MLAYDKRKTKNKRIARLQVGSGITEHQLQRQCEQYLRINNIVFIRVPDAIYKAIFGNRLIPPATRALISSFIKGLPDLTILLPSGKYICVELKTATGKMSQGQKEFARNIPVTICRTFEEFRKLVDEGQKL